MPTQLLGRKRRCEVREQRRGFQDRQRIVQIEVIGWARLNRDGVAEAARRRLELILIEVGAAQAVHGVSKGATKTAVLAQLPAWLQRQSQPHVRRRTRVI